MSQAVQQLRNKEFSRLDADGHAYLDYTGSGLYGESQIRTHAALLCEGALGNPHSQNPTSLTSTRLVALDRQGRLFDSKLVEARAGDENISLRTGCFCNPGAAEAAFGYGQSEAYECFDRLSPAAFTLQQFSACMDDKPVGAVRASLGIASNDADVRRLLEVLATFRDAVATPALMRSVPEVVSG